MTDKLLKIGIKAMKSIKKAYKQDRDHLVRLEQPIKVCRLAETVYGHAVPDWHGRLLDVADRVVTLLPPEPGEETCDGASFCPDKVDALDLDLAPSYLTHDAGTEEMDAMAEDPAWIAAGWTQPELRRLWDDLLGMMVRRQAEALKGWKRLAGNGLARVMRSAVRALGGIMHGHLSAILAAALLAVAGCSVPPDDTVVEEWFWAPRDKVAYTVVPKGGSEALPENASDPATEDAELEDASSGSVAGSVSSSPSLDFRFGGFRAKDPQEVAGCRIGNLKVGKDGLSYKWLEGGCEKLGASSREDYSQTVACAFYRDEKAQKWVGGKFDWISTSRTSRSFENIKEGYGGWDSAAFFAAGKHGFCIVSKDGRKRSNFIED